MYTCSLFYLTNSTCEHAYRTHNTILYNTTTVRHVRNLPTLSSIIALSQLLHELVSSILQGGSHSGYLNSGGLAISSVAVTSRGYKRAKVRFVHCTNVCRMNQTTFPLIYDSMIASSQFTPAEIPWTNTNHQHLIDLFQKCLMMIVMMMKLNVFVNIWRIIANHLEEADPIASCLNFVQEW